MLEYCSECRSWEAYLSISCFTAGLSRVTIRSLGLSLSFFPTLKDLDTVALSFISSLIIVTNEAESFSHLSMTVPSDCSGRLCITRFAFLFSLSKWSSSTFDRSTAALRSPLSPTLGNLSI